ncbi:MAG: amylo-alpha-1,6-glucosidase [Acidobacteria bacterium]|nr:amylo-alpha-1,6-glucosidase [Acidobacteriota bacterium]MCI0627256.1 amylo-alpha-1,6-glucosidase [Acidobacteriota bacterium]MCI0723677.1 amylo-alpha-1,6-glucosidase [Acidobacteriota bacterium]
MTPVAAQFKLQQQSIVIDEMTCKDYSKSSHLEWLETNGRGSFASGTVSGANTRRYHGLLVASLHPPVDRFVTLSKVEETFVQGDQRFELGASQFPFAVSPKGYSLVREFALSPFPRWTYDLNGLLLEKSVFMVRGENTTVVRYRLIDPGDSFAVLAVRPFVAFRDYHSLTAENGSIQQRPERDEPGLLQLHPYEGLPALKLHHNGVAFTVEPNWYRKFEYLEEQDRGLDFREDLFTHGYFSFELSSKSPNAFLVATLDDKELVTLAQVEELEDSETIRRQQIASGLSSTDPFVEQLALAADSFVITRADGASSVIAGYHWFTDWGRDTMISLPGLALTTQRSDLAKGILSSFLKYCDQGMLPNRFPDKDGAPEFNTVDATLWLFHAVHEYFRATHDLAFIRDQAFSKLEEVIDWHMKGTRYGIRMDATDGLLCAGIPGVQLTWMDAKIGDWVVTPRQGKPVEINALWHNAMRVMEGFSRQLKKKERAKFYQQLADVIRESFTRAFWNAEANCLYDCVQDGVPDKKIRPNQIFAVSLHFPLLPSEKAQAVVHVVKERLLTPYGLRSLAPEDSEYQKVYSGNPYERDSAYHQGTVWAWLIGPFVDAYLNAFGESEENCRYLESLLDGFRQHMSQAMLGSIAEIFDADPPHNPKGCAAQAWSVAEVLRAVQKLAAIRTVV